MPAEAPPSVEGGRRQAKAGHESRVERYNKPVRKFPLWLKIGWTIWVIVWFFRYLSGWGWTTFLWFCDIANFMICAGLWLESPLIFSWQAVSVLLVQIVWTIDFAVALVSGRHPIGGTEYMFDTKIPLDVRLLSLFHAATPLVLIWGLRKLGYDKRGWLCQTASAWVVLPISFVLPPSVDINWVHGPWDHPQKWMAPLLYLLICMVGYPAVLYFPSHLALSRIFKPLDPARGGSHAR